MNIDPKPNDQIARVINQLDLATSTLSVSQVLAELQVVIERLSFSGIYKNLKPGEKVQIADVDLLFEDEISDSMLVFIRWLADNNILSVVIDRTGLLFLDFCIKRYKQVAEVRFLTPIKLTSEMQQYVIQRLRQIYPAPARIIFEVLPALTAGFIIKDGTKTIDRSLQSMVTQSIGPLLRGTYRNSAVRQKVAHG